MVDPRRDGQAGGREGRVLGSMGGWTPHDCRKTIWDDGWDAEPRRARNPFGKPWKLVLEPVNHLNILEII